MLSDIICRYCEKPLPKSEVERGMRAHRNCLSYPAPDLSTVTIVPFEPDGPEALIGLPCAGFGDVIEEDDDAS